MDAYGVPGIALHALWPPFHLIFSTTRQHLADLLVFYPLLSRYGKALLNYQPAKDESSYSVDFRVYFIVLWPLKYKSKSLFPCVFDFQECTITSSYTRA